MGCYVNPQSLSKEEWLSKNGKPVSKNEAVITETELPVCLVNNGLFTAAGVCFDQGELDTFLHEDFRPKKWFLVSREKLLTVSDLKHYL